MNVLARHAGTRVFRLFSRPLDPRREPTRLDGMTLRVLDPHDALAMGQDQELSVAPEMARQAYTLGSLCIGAFHAERLAGYCWLAFSPVPHLDGVWADCDRQAVWTYKSFVRPEYRGRGIAAALYRWADAECLERGRRFSVMCVESHNRPSIRAAQKAHYRSLGLAAYATAGNVLIQTLSRGARRTGVRFFVPQANVARAA